MMDGDGVMAVIKTHLYIDALYTVETEKMWGEKNENKLGRPIARHAIGCRGGHVVEAPPPMYKPYTHIHTQSDMQ